MMTKLKFEITWEDVQHIAKQRNGYILNKKSAIALLSDIEDGVREWFVATKGDSICDALDRFIPTRDLASRDLAWETAKTGKIPR